MKILMIGLGSIGQRHVRNIRRIYGDTVEIIAYRVRKLGTTFSDAMKIREGVDLETEYNIRTFSELEEALAEKPDIAFITNITAKHMETALKCAAAGCNLFLEKPVSDSLEGTDELEHLVKKNNLKVFMGFQNRYHPCVEKLREYLEENLIGRVISVDASFCERLTTMHTYEDYSTTYMARKEMGGGPVLNLQSHDIDYLLWIFGEPVSEVNIVKGKHSSLNIDVEDHAVITYKSEYKGNPVTVVSRTDFLQYPPCHECKVVGEKGRIYFDFNKAEITLIVGDEEPKVTAFPDFVRNDMFIKELKLFMKAIEEDTETDIPLSSGIACLKTVLGGK